MLTAARSYTIDLSAGIPIRIFPGNPYRVWWQITSIAGDITYIGDETVLAPSRWIWLCQNGGFVQLQKGDVGSLISNEVWVDSLSHTAVNGFATEVFVIPQRGR